MDRRQILFTSDWHIGHKNIIKFSNRPFKDIEHMREVLIGNYNASSSNNTVGYFVGDMGFANSEELSSTIKRLNGTKVLILGNHDKQHESMYKTGFDVVINGITLWIAKHKVTITHCPLFGVYREDTSSMPKNTGENWHGERKNKEYTTEDVGQFHLHGHIHSPNNGKSTKILGRQMDIGVDANNYRPVSISQVESFISNTINNENNK